MNTKKVIVNYDGLPQGKGLRVATTTVPAALKTKLYFWSPTTDFTAKNFPLMTFPAGTGIATDEFKVYHCTSKDATTTEQFTDLGVQINGDSSMTLVANFEGRTVELNSWTADPVITKASWMVRDDEPGAVTPPVAKYGAETMKATINGEPWDGTMPTSVGSYTIVWSVAETADYTGISVQRTFEITEFVDPVNSNLRYFADNGRYWKGAGDMKSALAALPPEGGIVELNADLPDTQPIESYCFDKPVLLRSSTHPDKVGRRFTFKYRAVKMVAATGSLNVSNLVFDAREVISEHAFSGGVLGVQGGRLTLGDGVDVLTTMSWIAGTQGASIDVRGLVVTNHVGDFSAMVRALGSTLTIHPGTRISGVRCSVIFASGEDARIVIKGGEIVDNEILPDASSTRAAIKASGVVCIEGSPVIWNNKFNGKQSNVLPGSSDAITLTGDLGAKAKIGVSCGSAAGEQFGVVESGDPGRGFVCDQDEHLQGRAKKDGKLYWKSVTPGLVVFVI